jgi:hypothetical protein
MSVLLFSNTLQADRTEAQGSIMRIGPDHGVPQRSDHRVPQRPWRRDSISRHKNGDRRMINGLRGAGALCTVFLLVGCGESKQTMDARSHYGAFNQTITEVEMLSQMVSRENYKAREHPIEDQLTGAIHFFLKNEEVKGTPLEAEARKLLDQTDQIDEIWKSSDGSVEKIRAVVKEMSDQVEHMKTMM